MIHVGIYSLHAIAFHLVSHLHLKFGQKKNLHLKRTTFSVMMTNSCTVKKWTFCLELNIAFMTSESQELQNVSKEDNTRGTLLPLGHFQF